MCLTLQAPTGLDAIEVAVDVDLEQRGGVIRGPPAAGTVDSFETQETQIACFDKGIDHPHRIVPMDVVLQPIRKQKSLRTIDSINESLHAGHQSTGAEILPAA